MFSQKVSKTEFMKTSELNKSVVSKSEIQGQGTEDVLYVLVASIGWMFRTRGMSSKEKLTKYEIVSVV